MDCLRCFNKESDENNEEINKESNEKSDEKGDDKNNEKNNDKNNEKSDEKIDVDTTSILDDIVVIETDKSELNSPIILDETYCK